MLRSINRNAGSCKNNKPVCEVFVFLMCTYSETVKEILIFSQPLSMRGKVLSSCLPLSLLSSDLGGFKLTIKSVFLQPSFSRVRRSSLWAHTLCSTSPAPRTSRSERLLFPKVQRGKKMLDVKKKRKSKQATTEAQ